MCPSMKSSRLRRSSSTLGLYAKSIGSPSPFAEPDSGAGVSIGGARRGAPRASGSREKQNARLVGARFCEVGELQLVLRRLHDGEVRANPLDRLRIGAQAVLNDLDRASYFECRFFNEHPGNHRVSFLRRHNSPRRLAVPPLPRPFLPMILGILARKCTESDIVRRPVRTIRTQRTPVA